MASDSGKMIPVRIGKYAVIRKIASGGMAEVYLCRLRGEEGFEKKVAVKVIHPRLGEDRRFRELFAREARIAASLTHPNLIQVFDFGREGESLFLAMEFIDGWNMAQAISQARLREISVPLPVWRYWMEGILAGLGHLHSRKIVHRDISPSNVLLSRGGMVKITDFGIAGGALQRAEGRPGWEGKFSYMSPEQARGGDADARSDLFAAAAIAAEFYLPGRLFDGGSAEEILSRLRDYDLQGCDLGTLPPAVANVVMKGLSTRSEDRYADADEFSRAVCAAVPSAPGRSDLQSFWSVLFPEGSGEDDTVIADSISADRMIMVRESRGRYGKRNTRLVKIGILSAVAAISAGGWLGWREIGKSPGTGERLAGTSSQPGPPVAGTAATSVSGSAPVDVAVSPRTAPPPLTRGKEPEKSPPATPVRVPAPDVLPRTVLIETDPPGISVALDDGTPLGKTPIRLDLAPWTGRKILFHQEGYDGKSVQSDVLAQFRTFRLEMERQMGTIEAVQAIPWAKVYDGNRYVGDTPIQKLKLPVGKHRLRFVNEPLSIESVHEITVLPGANPKLIVPLVGKSGPYNK